MKTKILKIMYIVCFILLVLMNMYTNLKIYNLEYKNDKLEEKAKVKDTQIETRNDQIFELNRELENKTNIDK